MNSRLPRSFSGCICLFFLLAPFANVFPQASGESGLGFKLSSPYHSLAPGFQRNRQAVFATTGYVPGSVTDYFKDIKHQVELESLDSPVMVRQILFDEDLQPPAVFPFDDYVVYLRDQSVEQAWRDYAARTMTADATGSRSTGGINLEIPVKIKSKAFQKIFGSGTVGLVVTGDIRIQAGLRREDRSEVITALTRGATTNFKMEQTQRFSVTGRIGEKVKINVDQDSERAFDFDNNIRLVYDGFDDEIVRKFEAGNISLSLPGTRYVTFSGKNSGLFGLKSQMVFGNLNVTAIASQEKGESQKLSLNGGASSGSNSIDDFRYIKDQYFFLDNVYREQYRHFSPDGVHIAVADSGLVPDSLDVYKAAPGYDIKFSDRVIEGRAWFDPAEIGTDEDNFEPVEGERAQGQFIRLEPNEYQVSYELGWIRLNSPLSDGEILAVAYKAQYADSAFGNLNFVRDTTIVDNRINLKLIRDRIGHPAHPTWPLSWKHVYSLGSRNINEEGFEVRVEFQKSGAEPQPISPQGENWLTVFGLDKFDKTGADRPDGAIDIDVNIIDLANGELHFRDLQPFYPVGYWLGATPVANPDTTTEFVVKEIYTESDDNIIRRNSNFDIRVKTQNRGTEYNLGFNVIEGSEVVTLDGRVLQSGRDYSIDYFSGQLTMLSEDATNPTAQLDITYERNQLFQLEKKTILGMRAEYDLGPNSFIGSTLLYLSESTLDQKVRVGRGPMRNVVWDVNSKMRFTPNWIGQAFNAMPLIRSTGETILNFEGEVAQVLPTPNTLNNPNTQDNRGVAYIDDFEAAKKTINLGVLRRNWTHASAPRDGIHDHSNRLNNFIWYNPFDQISIKDIYPNRDTESTTGGQAQNRTHVLRMDFFDPKIPDSVTPDAPAGGRQTRLRSPQWTGVMRALSAGFFDQSQTKFIEIMVQGDRGRLHIDLGSISEDVIGNGRLDTEDKTVPRNGVLEAGEDTGIDGIVLPDPPTLNFDRNFEVNTPIEDATHDFWDVNSNGLKDADEPWSYDDWRYDSGRVYIFQDPAVASINGSEGSQDDDGGRLPDTEDINGNGILDPSNNYYTYSFSLDPQSEDADLIAGGNFGDPNDPDNPVPPGGPWKLFRIPFVTSDTSSQVGNPSPTLIEFVRIWVDDMGFDQGGGDFRVSIAEINLVGSEWKEVGVTDKEFELTSNPPSREDIGVEFAVAQINTHDSDKYVQSLEDADLRRAFIVEDKVTRVEAREQSLVLKSIGLRPGYAGIAQKSLFQGENYIHYDRIRMFVYGDSAEFHIPSTPTDSSNLEYFVRFGTNDDNYYEYRSPVYAGWDDRNHMEVRVLDFTSIEPGVLNSADRYVDRFADEDSVNVVRRLILPGMEEVVKELRVVGTPSFTNIRVLTAGIKNIHDMLPFTGEIWLNELRLSDVEQDKGMAMRASVDLKIGDFATVNAEIERKEADFHNVATRFGNGDNSVARRLNANIRLDKMLPQSLGISMPLTLNVRQSDSTPKYFPGRDREVTQADLDDADQLSKLEKTNSQTGFNLSFKRSVKSKNFFVKNLVDKLSMSVGKSSNLSKTPTVPVNESTRWQGKIDWSLDFGRNNYFSPFAWLPGLPLIKKAKETKLYYTPQSVSLGMSGTRNETERRNRIANTDSLAAPDRNLTFNADRRLRANMKVFDNLSVTYSKAYKSQLKNKKFSDLLNWDFENTDENQQFNAKYSPEVFSWLTNSVEYDVKYSFTTPLQNRETGRRARNDVTRSANVNFRWKQLVNSIFGGGSQSRGRSGGRRTRPGGRTRPGSDGGGDKEQKFTIFQEKKSGSSFNPLKLVGGFFSGFKDIQMTLRETVSNQQAGLLEGQRPSLAFQFGADSTGVGTAEGVSGNLFQWSQNRNLSLSSGIAAGRIFDVTLRFSQTSQEGSSSTSTGVPSAQGNNSISYLAERDLNIPFPEWTVSVTGLQRLPFMNKVFKTLTFSHGYVGQKTENWRGDKLNLNSESINSNFRPLGKLAMNFKNGFTGNIQFNRTRSTNTTFARDSEGNAIPQGVNLSNNDDLTISANYSKKSGFSIPIWPFNKAKLKNSIDFNFSFTASNVVTRNKRAGGVFTVSNKTERWTLRPEIKYSFSTTVRGGVFIEVGKTFLNRSGTTKVQEFGLDVNIAIRGN